MNGRRKKFLKKAFIEIAGYAPPKARINVMITYKTPRTMVVGSGKCKEIVKLADLEMKQIQVTQPDVFRGLKKADKAHSFPSKYKPLHRKDHAARMAQRLEELTYLQSFIK